MKRLLAVVALLAALVAWSQSTVTSNQGSPGKMGPWPVTGVGFTTSDAGFVTVAETPATCQLLLNDAGTPYRVNFWDAGTTVFVPGDIFDAGSSSSSDRKYVVICSCKQNITSFPNALWKCRSDGTAPVMAVNNPGDVLGVGDCVIYASPKGTVQKSQCISDTASSFICSYECL